MRLPRALSGVAARLRVPASTAAAPDGRARVYGALSDVAHDSDALARSDDLSRFERRVFSQNGEDGVVVEIFRRIGVLDGWFVEFGAGTGHEGNCVLLADVFGWSGAFIEADPGFYGRLEAKYLGSDQVRTVRARVTPESADDLFADAGAPEEPDLLSIDVDGDDWWIWRAVARLRARVVIVEYNATLHPRRALVRPRSNVGWDATTWFGASLRAYERLASDKGYTLVHTELTGTNAFFVRDDLLVDLGSVEPPRRTANYLLSGTDLLPDSQNRPWIDLDADPIPFDAG